MLQARFGSVPDSLESKLAAIHDLSVLESLVLAAATCGSLEEFERGMGEG